MFAYGLKYLSVACIEDMFYDVILTEIYFPSYLLLIAVNQGIERALFNYIGEDMCCRF